MAVRRRRQPAQTSNSTTRSGNTSNAPAQANPSQANIPNVAQSTPLGPKDSARKWIAYIYVFSFVAIVSGTLIFMFWRCYNIFDIKDALLAESGILSGPLGFIIGFYFKEEFEKK